MYMSSCDLRWNWYVIHKWLFIIYMIFNLVLYWDHHYLNFNFWDLHLNLSSRYSTDQTQPVTPGQTPTKPQVYFQSFLGVYSGSAFLNLCLLRVYFGSTQGLLWVYSGYDFGVRFMQWSMKQIHLLSYRHDQIYHKPFGLNY